MHRLAQNALKGISFYATGIFMIVVMNSFAKLASDVHHPVEIVFYRNLAIILFLLGIIAAQGRWQELKTKRPRAHLWRSLVGTFSVILVFYAYQYLPVADATALLYAAPLIITALSMPVLKEPVGLFRWAAVITGFIGVLVIVNPAGGGDAAGYIFGLAAAVTIAAVSLLVRDLGKTELPLTTVFYFMLIGLFVTAPAMIFIGQVPAPGMIGILLVVSIAGLAQQFLKTHALAIAPAATLSPLQFTGLVWAVLFGFVLFGDWPDTHIWIGGFIIIASNLFIIAREQIVKKRAASKALV